MKNCTDCNYAEWKLTAAGKLHRSGDGVCKFVYKFPPLPQCNSWIGNPIICGSSIINRKTTLRDHCAYYTPKVEK